MKKQEGLQAKASTEARDTGDAFEGLHLSWGHGSVAKALATKA